MGDAELENQGVVPAAQHPPTRKSSIQQRQNSPFTKTVGLTLTFGVLVKVFDELIVCFRTEGVIFEAVEMNTLLSVLLM